MIRFAMFALLMGSDAFAREHHHAKFAVHAGRCAWNLMAYGDRLAAPKPGRPGEPTH